jgi:Ca2+-binding EF-hand superfamily protein
MLSSETDSRLAKMLLVLADGEASVEVTRTVLANQIGFDAYSLFKLIDSCGKGWIDSVNIVDFLRAHHVYAGSFDAQNIIYHYDADCNSTLNYSEFVNLVVSEKNTVLRNSSLSGLSYKSVLHVPYDVELSCVRLLEKELDFVKCLHGSVRDLNLRYDFNVLDAFKSMDIYNLDNLSTDSLRKFLIRNFITPSESDLTNIFKRLDVDRDFRVNYTEFKALATAYTSGTPCHKHDHHHNHTHTHHDHDLSYTSYYSPLRRTYYSPLRRSYYSPLRSSYYSPYRTRLHCSPRKCYSPLRTFYSPPKTIEPYSSLRSNANLNSTMSKTNNDLNKSVNKNSSPLRNTTSRSLVGNSPRRVNSPQRNVNVVKETNLNTSVNNLNNTVMSSSVGLRYPSYEEEVFINYLRELIAVECSLEVTKNEVALKNDFNMEDAFSIFEKYNKGYLTEFDLKDGLNGYFGLFPLLEEVSTLFKRYDTEKLGSFNYGDFFNMLAPFSQEYRKLVEDRIYPNSTLVGDPLSVSTKFSVKNLLQNLIQSEQTLESHRSKMKNMLSFNSKKIFELIGGYASSYFSERDVSLFLFKF